MIRIFPFSILCLYFLVSAVEISAEDYHPNNSLPKNAVRNVDILTENTSVLVQDSDRTNAPEKTLQVEAKVPGDFKEPKERVKEEIIIAKKEEAKKEPPKSTDTFITKSVKLKETDEEIQIEIASDVLFDFDRWGIRPQARQTLEEVSNIIEKYRDLKVVLGGHTDSIGTHAYNENLSLQRAKSVQAWLIHQAALYDVKMAAVGYGETRPIAPNTKRDGSDDPKGRQKNRRVEIRIKK